VRRRLWRWFDEGGFLWVAIFLGFLLSILLTAGCSSIVGTHPFSSLPKSDLGKPERAHLFVQVAPHPWLVVTPRGSRKVDMVIFVTVRGRGWEQRRAHLEAEFPGGTLRTAQKCVSWTINLVALKPGAHAVSIRAVASDGEVLQTTKHAWTVWDWYDVREWLGE